jgi:hypothetical protein
VQTTVVSNELNAAPWTPPASKAPAIVREAPPAPAERDNGLVLRPAFDDRTKGLQAAPAVLNVSPGPIGAPAAPATAPLKTTPAAAPKVAPLAPGNGEGGSDAEFALQLGSFKSEDLAKTGWKTVLKSAGDLLGGLSHGVEPVVLADQRRVYRLFAEALPDRQAALDLCRTLRDKGIPCIVVRR